ncbi:MAG: hypothetical protein WA093_01765 [Minisyncoccales bacterium]
MDLASIIILAIIIVAAAVIIGYLAGVDKRIGQLEQAIYSKAKTVDNGDPIVADSPAKTVEKIIEPDNSATITGTIIKIEKEAISINMSMDPNDENYNYIARINENTSLNKQKEIGDQSTTPAKISDMNIGDIAIIESAGQIGANNELTARKINFLAMPENQPQG